VRAALARVLPLTTKLCASVASKSVARLWRTRTDLRCTRTVIVLPAGMVCAHSYQRQQHEYRNDPERFPSIVSSFRTNPWQYYEGQERIAKNINYGACSFAPRFLLGCDPRLVSRDLLGKILLRRHRRKILGWQIVEGGSLSRPG